MRIPVLCLTYRAPPDGLPLLHSWVGTLKEIVFGGFEAWREVIEVKVNMKEGHEWGQLGYGLVLPVKGLGRISIILWILMHTYKTLRMDIEKSPELKADFQRPAQFFLFLAYLGIKVSFFLRGIHGLKKDDGLGGTLVFSDIWETHNTSKKT